MEPVSLYVEAAIYLYFVLVATIGCAVSVRLWLSARRRPDRRDDSTAN